MLEKTISLELIDPVTIYGVNNSNLDHIISLFPKLKVVARGSEIKVLGNEEEIARFEDKFNRLAKHIHQFNFLNKEIINEIVMVAEPKTMQPEDVLVHGVNGKPIKARNVSQQKLMEDYKTNDLLFAIGPAGTGKTYIAIAMAIRAIKNKEAKRIVLTRPAVETGERLGFLPGDMKEKLDPYLQPLYDALFDMVPAKKLEDYFEEGIIQIAPLAYMRGRTLSNSVVILDEAQNATLNQLKMFLTRMGENSKFIVTGDVTQIDLPNKYNSGLVQGIKILNNIEGISINYFDTKDIVRHRLVRDIVDAYEKADNLLINNEK